MMSRIAMMVVGHRDYRTHIGEEMAGKTAASLQDAGIEVVLEPAAAVDPITARKTALRLLQEDPAGVIIYFATWLECSVAMAGVKEVGHLPLLFWGYRMFMNEGVPDSTGSYVGMSVFKGAMARTRYHFDYVVGSPDNSQAVARATGFCRAAIARQQMRRSRIGLIGYASMSMYPGTFDHLMLSENIGPEVEHISTYTLVRRSEESAASDRQQVIDWIKGLAAVDDAAVPALDTIAGMYLACSDIVRERYLDAINIKCQYELSQEYGCTACVPAALLAEDGVITGCEGDVLTSVSMMVLQYLSQSCTTYADVLDIRGKEILWSACGFAPFALASDPDKRRLRPFEHPGFKGVLCSYTLRPGRVTYARLAEKRCGYRMVAGTGTGMLSELRQGLFPALRMELDGEPGRFMDLQPSQHFAIVYGEWLDEIAHLCRMLDVEVQVV